MIRTLIAALGLGLVGSCFGASVTADDDDSASTDDDDVVVDDDDVVEDDDDVAPDDDDVAPDDDDDAAPDADSDGLPDAFEQQIGTDPADPDSDGDGHTDGAEHLAWFFALDATDWPYAGGYPRGPLPDVVAGEGWDEGQVSQDWAGVDQHGEVLMLQRFYGLAVVVVVLGEWTEPLQPVAAELQAHYEASAANGLVVIALLIDGLDPLDGQPDVARFVAAHGVTFPVLADGARALADHYLPDSGMVLPTWTLLDRDLRVVDREGAGMPPWSQVDELLAAPPPAVDWPLP